MISAQKALGILKEGNKRFVANQSAELHRTHKLIDNQTPFTIVLSCSDSRVPPEIVFDQGIGDMFIIRVAGNIVTPVELGSAEFAALNFGTRLLVVMGHTKCGAVQATIQTTQTEPSKKPTLSQGLQIIVDQIATSVNENTDHTNNDSVNEVIKANVINSAQRLHTESKAIADLTKNDGLMIVGAVYAIETGTVEFFDIPK